MRDVDLIAIGSSTGGVDALISVLSVLEETAPPIMITQHTGPSYSASLAQLLDRQTVLKVVEPGPGDPLQPGMIYLAPGDQHHMLVHGTAPPKIRLTEGPSIDWHRPSVTAMFQSAASLGPRAIGVILTGMGRDGAQGLLEMRQAGATTIGQDEASCVVYGMPKVAREVGAVQYELPLNRIGMFLNDLCAGTTHSLKGMGQCN